MSAKLRDPFVEVGPNDELPAGAPELIGDETCCAMGDNCIGAQDRGGRTYPRPIGEYLWCADPAEVEIVRWDSPWFHPMVPTVLVCEDCAWHAETDADCPLCFLGVPHTHIMVAESDKPVAAVLVDPEDAEPGPIVVD